MDSQAREKAKEDSSRSCIERVDSRENPWLLGTFGDLENCVLPIKTLERSFNLLNDS